MTRSSRVASSPRSNKRGPSAPRRSATAAQRAWPRLADRYRLGTSPVGVSPICLGRVGVPSVIPEAFDAGVNFFFVTADMHWPIYEAARRGLEMLLARGGGVRDDMVIGVVSYVAQPEFLRVPFEEVVAAIPGMKRVDISIIGGAYAADLTTRLIHFHHHRRSDALGVQAIGATFHERLACAHAVNHDLVDIGFVRYNAAHRSAEHEVFAKLGNSRSLLYNFKSTIPFLDDAKYKALGLGHSYWRPRITDYYRFALSRPELDGILCAFDRVEHVAELAAALADGPLSPEQIEHLDRLAALSPR